VALLSVVVITADGLIQYYSWGYDLLHYYPAFTMRPIYDGGGFFRGYPTASFPYPNDLAAWILLMLLPLACVTLFGMKKSKFKYLTGFISAALFYLFFLTKVRSAWIGLGISMLYIAFSKRKIWIALLLVLVLFASILVKTEMTRAIFATGSISDRVNMLGTSYQIFMKHPVIGNGLNTFFVNFMKYRNDEWKDKKGSYAHNCYLQMAADTGLVGLAGFLFLIFSYFRAVIKELRVIKDDFYRMALWGISIGVFAFLVHSFFDTNLYSLNLATLFWFAIGTSLAIIKVSKTTGL
jgi:O-antigen ligase